MKLKAYFQFIQNEIKKIKNISEEGKNTRDLIDENHD
jgi:hypothetical protein